MAYYLFLHSFCIYGDTVPSGCISNHRQQYHSLAAICHCKWHIHVNFMFILEQVCKCCYRIYIMGCRVHILHCPIHILQNIPYFSESCIHRRCSGCHEFQICTMGSIKVQLVLYCAVSASTHPMHSSMEDMFSNCQ